MGRKKIISDSEMVKLLTEFVSIYGISKVTDKNLEEFANLKGIKCSYQVFRTSTVKKQFMKDLKAEEADLSEPNIFIMYNINEVRLESKIEKINFLNEVNGRLRKLNRKNSKLQEKLKQCEDDMKELKSEIYNLKGENESLKETEKKLKGIRAKNKIIDKEEAQDMAGKIINFDSANKLNNVVTVDTDLYNKINEVEEEIFDNDNSDIDKKESRLLEKTLEKGKSEGEEELFSVLNNL